MGNSNSLISLQSHVRTRSIGDIGNLIDSKESHGVVQRHSKNLEKEEVTDFTPNTNQLLDYSRNSFSKLYEVDEQSAFQE